MDISSTVTHQLRKIESPFNFNLIKAIKENQWNLIAVFLDEASALDRDKRTALHYICSKIDPPLYIVKKILQAFPAAAYQKDIYGKTPLFIYLSRVSFFNEELIFYFMESVPDCVKIDKAGVKMLSQMISKKHLFSVKLINKVIELDPDAVVCKNHLGYSTLCTFFKKWHTLLRRALTEINFPVSYEEILQIEVTRAGSTCTLDRIYRIGSSLLRSSDQNSKKEDWLVLHSAIANPSCPWVFCELMIHLHPEQIHLLNGESAPLSVILCPMAKEKNYSKLISCSSCHRESLRKQTLWFNENLHYCKNCHLKLGYAGICHRKLNWVEIKVETEIEAEEVSFLYFMIKHNPSICIM